MTWKGFASAAKAYVGSLLATALFPILWMRSVRLARRHTDVDPRAPAKVAIAIALSIGIAAVGAYTLLGLRDRATDGIYDSLDARLAVVLGESEYQSNVETAKSKPAAIAIIESRIAAEEAAGNDTAELQAGLYAAQTELAVAQGMVGNLTPNHELYLRVSERAQAQDDAGVRGLIASGGLDKPDGIEEGTERAFTIKEESMRGMDGWFAVFLWPSLVGAFFAPLAFALGSILKAAFVPSDSVGFKPYPGAAAGLFLLLGAFGLPSLLFAAWTFMDAEQRSAEGQISL